MNPKVIVRDLMVTDVVSIRPEAALHEAVALLLEHRVSGLPVVDGDQRVVGIVTERDCLRSAFASDYYRERGGTVGDAMTQDPVTIDAAADIMRAIDLFLGHPFRRLPVVEGQRIVGVLSRRDVLRMLAVHG